MEDHLIKKTIEITIKSPYEDREYVMDIAKQILDNEKLTLSDVILEERISHHNFCLDLDFSMTVTSSSWEVS